MDKQYIQLCAEMAYNEVIMESVLNENSEVLSEVSAAELFNIAKEKISKIGESFLTAIKTLANKILGFIRDLLNKIKNSADVAKYRKEVEGLEL